MALLVHQQFAVDAFVALSSQTPDTVCTDGTVGSLHRRKTVITKQSTDYIPGDATEAAMASETCSPAGPESNPTRATALCHHYPSYSINQYKDMLIKGMSHSPLNTHTVTKL